MIAMISWFAGIWQRVRFLFMRERELRELDEELRLHAELRAADFRRAGLSDKEALRAARQAVGDPLRWREDTVAAASYAWLDTLVQDARFGLRFLRRGGVATAASVMTLALGLGGVLAIVTLVNVLILKPTYPRTDRLAVAYQVFTPGFFSSSDTVPMQLGRFSELQALVPAMREAGFATWDEVNLGIGGGAERIRIGFTTAGLFSALGIAPALGRVHTDAEDVAGAPVALLSYAFWRSRYNSNRSAIGSDVMLNGTRFTIIGVMPAQFRGVSDRAVLWIPARSITKMPPNSTLRFDNPERAIGNVIVRLPDEIRPAEAQRQLENAAAAVPARVPPGRTIALGLIPFSVAQQHALQRSILLLLSVAVGAVLLIVCANVIGLLLARLRTRRVELAVRASLGAGRARLTRQLIIEGITLALLGGIPALGLAYLGALALARMRPALPDSFVLLRGADLLEGASLAPNVTVLGFTLLIVLGTGTAIGLATAFAVPRGSLLGALKTAGAYTVTGRTRGRHMLVITQVALATALLAGAGLTLRSLRALMAAPLGYRTENVVVAQLALTEQRPDASVRRRELLDRIASLPGVTAVATAQSTPFVPEATAMMRIDRIDGQPVDDGAAPAVESHTVSRDYFRTLGIPLRAGNAFDAGVVSSEQTESVLVNETAARALWPGQNPIGRRFGGDDGPAQEVTGVVGDARYQRLQTSPAPAVFTLAGDADPPPTVTTLFIHSDQAMPAVVSAVRQLVDALEPGTALFNTGTLEQRVRTAAGSTRYVTQLLVGFGAIAALLAAVGVYGLLSYGVVQRRRELGLRLAVGAQPRALVAGVVGEGALLMLVGLTLGIAAAAVGTSVLKAFLFEIGAHDPLALGGAAIVLAVIGLFAALLPARRAARVDPLIVLRD